MSYIGLSQCLCIKAILKFIQIIQTMASGDVCSLRHVWKKWNPWIRSDFQNGWSQSVKVISQVKNTEWKKCLLPTTFWCMITRRAPVRVLIFVSALPAKTLYQDFKDKTFLLALMNCVWSLVGWRWCVQRAKLDSAYCPPQLCYDSLVSSQNVLPL